MGERKRKEERQKEKQHLKHLAESQDRHYDEGEGACANEMVTGEDAEQGGELKGACANEMVAGKDAEQGGASAHGEDAEQGGGLKARVAVAQPFECWESLCPTEFTTEEKKS